ncbi:MAG: NAD-dependent epimerase/dehydratase family protein [Candidatus Azotimanducaceae bacterium]
MKNKSVFVTGASGFIASHCIIDLLKNNYRIVGTIRDVSREKTLRSIISGAGLDNKQIEFKKADLREPDEISSAIRGCDAVFHIASPVPIIQPKNREDIIETAKQGTLNVLKAARNNSVERVVLTSSVATLFDKTDNKSLYTPRDWANPEAKRTSPYSQSKILAEQAAWKYGIEESINLTTIHPSLVLGPCLERDYGSSLEAIVKILNKELPLIPNFGFEIVDVRDVARLHRLALEDDSSIGKRLIASTEFLWFSEIAANLKKKYPDRKIPTRAMPNWLAKLISLFIPELREILLSLGRKVRFSNKESIRLGWQPMNIDKTIFDTAESLLKMEKKHEEDSSDS